MELETRRPGPRWPFPTPRPRRPDASGRRTRESGLTIVEVPIALALLAFGLLAMAPMFTGAVRTNASAFNLTNANTLAREKMEELIGYPSTDPRLAVPTVAGANAAGPTGTSTTGTGSIVTHSAYCDNDLPRWYKPSTGAVSPAATSPGIGWFLFPYTRTYTVEQFREDLTTRVVAPGTYGVKLLTVIVRPTSGPFPGLRQTTQSVYVRFRDASPN
jgi:Tfp pilus assembly protein PilV